MNFVFDRIGPLDPEFCKSWVPAAAELIRQFISFRPRHLVLFIEFGNIADLTNVDISPLTVLQAASESIPRIDLHVSARDLIFVPNSAIIPITAARLMSALENYPEVVKLINEGKIAVHSQKTAP